MPDEVDPGAHSVLIVDDASTNRRLYGWILGRAGFRILTATDGIDALEQLGRCRPSLVLLDFVMPRLDGVGVLRRMRAEYGTERIPVVMLTSSAAPDDIDKALEAGANDYITKPVNSRILVTRIRSLIQADQDREHASKSREAESLRRELDEAHRVQQAQLPPVPTRWRDWSIVGAVAPSGRVGGDVFDLVQTEDDRLVAVLIDVTGHGTGSALVAAETRAELRHLLQGRSLLASVVRLNAHLARRETGRYSCIAAVEIDGDLVRVLNAGLPPVVLIRGGGILGAVAASGLPIGMFDSSAYELTEWQTQPGDRLVLVSDGITEPFGVIDDVAGAIERLGLDAPSPARPDADGLRDDILRITRSAGSEPLDDATALVLDRTGRARDTLRISPRPEAVARAVRWVVAQRPTWVDRSTLDYGITEALTNAVFHGALELSPRARRAGDYEAYVRQAASLADSSGRRHRGIHLSILRSRGAFGIRIRWDGAPCPQGARRPPRELGPLQESGMGITIMHALFDRVLWAEDGRSVELWLTRGDR